jgi:hypothetical protein
MRKSLRPVEGGAAEATKAGIADKQQQKKV